MRHIGLAGQLPLAVAEVDVVLVEPVADVDADISVDDPVDAEDWLEVDEPVEMDDSIEVEDAVEVDDDVDAEVADDPPTVTVTVRSQPEPEPLLEYPKMSSLADAVADDALVIE